jgi:hypothetical protein
MLPIINLVKYQMIVTLNKLVNNINQRIKLKNYDRIQFILITQIINK